MNAIEFIRQDYEKFRNLFKEYENAKSGNNGDRRPVVERLYDELKAHEGKVWKRKSSSRR